MILTAPHPHVFAPPAAPQWLLDDSLALPLPEAPARLAQSAERKALNLVVVGSSPTVGALPELPRWPHTAISCNPTI